MLARSGPVCRLVRDPVLFPYRPCLPREHWLDSTTVTSPSITLCSPSLSYTFEFDSESK